MKPYELTIIAPAELTVVGKIELEKVIKEHAHISKRVVNGVKRLAYPIRNEDWGLYLYYELDIDVEDDNVTKLSGQLNIHDDVMRYLLIKRAM